MDRTSSAYNVPFIERLSGALVVDKLVAAVKAAAARHESLRTVYGSDESGEVFQCPLPVDEWVLPVCEVVARSEEDAESKVAKESEKPFILEKSSMRLSVVHV